MPERTWVPAPLLTRLIVPVRFSDDSLNVPEPPATPTVRVWVLFWPLSMMPEPFRASMVTGGVPKFEFCTPLEIVIEAWFAAQ